MQVPLEIHSSEEFGLSFWSIYGNVEFFPSFQDTNIDHNENRPRYQLLKGMACNYGDGLYPELNHGSSAKRIKRLTKDTIGGFNGGRYSDLDLASVLYTHLLDDQEHVKLKV